MGPAEGSIAAPLSALIELKNKGLIRPLGLSNVTPTNLPKEKSSPKSSACRIYITSPSAATIRSSTNCQKRRSLCPVLPLGGFTPLQSKELDAAAAEAKSTPMQVALAWLLHRSPNILLIPGTSAAEHLRENLKAAAMHLPPKVIAELNAIANAAAQAPRAHRSPGH